MATILEDLSLEDLLFAFDAGTRGRALPKAPPQTVLRRDKTHGKHLALLDGLALLLVAPVSRTKESQQGIATANDDAGSSIIDVAAVSMDVQAPLTQEKRTTMTIRYTKHVASSSEQEMFIDDVIGIAQRANDTRELKEPYAALSELVYRHCKPKIASRFVKVAERWKRRSDLQISEAPSQLLEEHLSRFQSAQVLPQHRLSGPWSTWLEGFLSSCFGKPMPRDWTELWSILRVCNRVSSSKGLLGTIGSSEIEEAISKLAMFDRVVMEMVGAAKAQPPTTFRVCQVPPAPPVTRAFRPALETFNAVGNAFIPGFQPFRSDQARRLDAAGLAAAGQPPTLSRCECFVHAECNLAVQLLADRTTASRELEIGVAKYSCWLCTLFLSELATATGSPIIISNYHSTVYRRWKFSDSLPSALGERIRLAITKRLLDEVRLIVEDAHEKTAALSGANRPELVDLFDELDK